MSVTTVFTVSILRILIVLLNSARQGCLGIPLFCQSDEG